METVLVKNFPNITLAEMAQQTLEAEGILSMLKGDSRTGLYGMGVGAFPASQGIDLYVADVDAERATKLLREIYDGM